MIRIGAAAIRYARSITRWPVGYCQKFVRTCFGVGSGFSSAKAQWYGAQHRHGPTSAIPAGVPVFFRGGKYWHVAMSVGGGKCRSTDWPRAGQVNDVDIQKLADAWGYPYVGWAEDVNGVRIYTKPERSSVKPIVPLARSTKMGAYGWQVPDLRWVLYAADFLSKTYLPANVKNPKVYDGNVQAAVKRFHESDRGRKYRGSGDIRQIGPEGFKALQYIAGRR